MNGYWLIFPWVATGCASASLEGSPRLTPFRNDLYREGVLNDLVVDGRRYCVAEVGDGPPLVLLHGLGGSIYDWRHLLRPLARTHRVIALDLLGAGESDMPEHEDYSISAQARRVKAVLDRLGVERATFVGNSYGGGIALRMAQDWPERVERLVLINSVCYAEHIPTYVALAHVPCAVCVAETLPLGKMTRWVLRGSFKTVQKLSEEELDTYIKEIRAPGRRRTIIHIVRAIVPPDVTEFEARLKTIKASTLLLWGVDDQTVPVELGRRLVRDLPDAMLYELDAGHVPNQECPEEVLRRMNDFLR